MVSVTPSGGWTPACVAGHTGFGMSQRMQSFVLDSGKNPYNVVEPVKRPRATLTPAMALKDGKPFLSFSVQGGDQQDRLLLQLFLDMVEFDMDVQQACEAPDFISGQMQSSFGAHTAVQPHLPDDPGPPHPHAPLVSALGIGFRDPTPIPLPAHADSPSIPTRTLREVQGDCGAIWHPLLPDSNGRSGG